ncbi:YfiR family protein [Aeromonas hydrophila]|uniref:YfiR family protein n=1 Tax=Aeromonas hydrophila TaxID=644 RepID=UPI000588B4D9|nr:YfiR family protein [Aeromonas hydrophila]AJE36684.1 hypothetical protein V469_12885 [Aeromonas hydrophila J-1]
MGADVGLSAGTMHSFSLIRILAWLAPLVCTLALSTEPPPLTSAELRAEQVRQTVLDILSYTRWPTEPSELRLCVADSVFCLQIGKERIRFRVNLDALARSGVRVHPAVLKLAKADEGGS